jgi:hypothetical protein
LIGLGVLEGVLDTQLLLEDMKVYKLSKDSSFPFISDIWLETEYIVHKHNYHISTNQNALTLPSPPTQMLTDIIPITIKVTICPQDSHLQPAGVGVKAYPHLPTLELGVLHSHLLSRQ